MGGQSTGQIEPVFEVVNDKHMRQELEVAIEKINGNIFRGTLTLQEAKHNIFKDCMKFYDFANFDGVRSAYRGCPVFVFKLKTPINVDELLPIQFFEYKRKTSRQGVSHLDVISCKIRGLRQPGREIGRPAAHMNENAIDDGTRLVRIEGCEYRIPKNTLLGFLSHYGDIVSEIAEDLFDDGSDPMTGAGGTNRTGNYSVKIRIKKAIPQLLPILGRRIKINYPGIQRLCTNCFNKHPKQTCQSRKVTWPSYVKMFVQSHPEIRASMFGSWHEHSNPKYNPGPNLRDVRAPPYEASVEDQPGRGPSVTPSFATVQRTSSDVSSLMHLDATEPITTDSDSGNRASAMTAGPPSTQPPMQTPLALSSSSAEPQPSCFRVPSNPAEREEMMASMMGGGLTREEAVQNIAIRRTAYNKAVKEFKKSGNKKQTKRSKNSTKTSKHADNDSFDYDN